MRVHNTYFAFILLFSICFTSCEPEQIVVQGMTPLYVSSTDFSLIRSELPRQFENLGNIVNVGDYIFLNEKGKGIHVLDNSDPSLPVNTLFWNIPGNLEFTIKDNTLYADNSIHLLVIDITDINDIQVLSYVENLYLHRPVANPRPEEPYSGPFNCVKKENGVHVGWKVEELIDPLCRTR